MKSGKLKNILKRTMKVASKATVAFMMFLNSTPALSAIPYRNAFEQMDMINAQTKELNLELLARIQIIIDQESFNLADYIPTNRLHTGDDSAIVARQILKKTMRSLFETEGTSTAPAVRNARAINSAFATSIDSVSINFKPLEATAALNYRGFVAATLAYDVQEKEAIMEVSKSVGSQTYAFTHTNNSEGASDVVGVRWNF